MTLFFFVTGIWATRQQKVRICHANQGNGWVSIEVDPEAIDGNGQSDHNRSSHQNGADIIPPGYWDQNGRNWNQQGIQIWENGCNQPKPTPTPTLTPTPTATVSPSPTPTPTPDISNTPTPTPTVSPSPGVTVTPTPTEVPRQADPAPEVWQFRSEAPICTDLAPIGGVVNFHVYRRGDTAILKWWPDAGASPSVHIWYFENQNPANIHAVGDVPNTGTFEVTYLSSLDWTFGVQPANGCAGGDIHWVVDGDTTTWQLFR